MRIIIFILCFFPIIIFSQNVGINTDGSSGDPSALLDVKSTTQGMLVPRMTSAQRDLINPAATGLLIFDTTLGAFHFYNGTGWQNLSEGAVLSDSDGDTKIEVEQNPDEDIVRITAGGNEIVKIHADRIDMNSYNDNTILGEDAAENISGANLSTIIGARAGRNFTGDYGVFIGVDAYKETQGQYNTAIGYQSAANDSFGYHNTFLGAEAGKNNKGYQSVFIGKGAGINNDAPQAISIGNNAGALNKGSGNIFIGANAGSVSTGFNNLFVGNNAGLQNSTGGGNTYIGHNSGKDGNGFANVHLGSGSGTKSIGYQNVIIGDQTAKNSTNGNKSVLIGSNAALWDTLSTANVIIGSEAGTGGPNSAFKHMKKENVLIGERAGFSLQGNGNTAVGYRAGQSATGSSNVFLGREAGASELGNNKLYISNTSSIDPLIYGEFDNDLVKINNKLEVINTEAYATAITGKSLNPMCNFLEATYGGYFVSGGCGAGVYGEATNVVGANYGGYFKSTGAQGAGVYGSSINQGGRFETNGSTGIGVYAVAHAASGENYGAFIVSHSSDGTGVYGSASAFSGSNYGGYFSSNSTTGIGARGIATNSSGINYGGYFSSVSGTGRGVYGKASSSTGANYGGYFLSESKTGTGVYGIANSTLSGTNIGGEFKAAGSTGIGVYGSASGSNATAILAYGTGSSSTGIFAQGVYRAANFQGEVETNGHLHINAPVNDAKIYMKSISGPEGRVLQRQNNTEDVYIGDIDNNGGDAFIRANGVDRFVVRQDGSVEIKDPANPALTFERTTAGSYDAQITVGSSSHIYLKNGNQLGSLENSMIIRNDGEVRIYHSGTNGEGLLLQNRVNNKSWSLYTDELASGNLHLYSGTSLVGNFNSASGVYTATSDRRRKEDIVNLGGVMEKVQELQIKKYRFRNQSPSEPESIGLIAQDVKSIFPEFVTYDEDTDTYTMDYAGLSSIALKAIQEQNELIKNLQRQIDELKAK